MVILYNNAHHCNTMLHEVNTVVALADSAYL